MTASSTEGVPYRHGRDAPRKPSVYSFQGLLSVEVAHRGLDALLARELGSFRVDQDDADCRVEEGPVPAAERVLSYRTDELNYSFDDSTFVLETPRGNIRLRGNDVRAESGVSPDLLLDLLLTMYVRPRATAKGATMVHSSAVSREGLGLLFPAWAHTGKTNLALSFLTNGFDYLSDDWSFVSASGELMGLPRWLALFDYNLRCHPQLIQAFAARTGRDNLKRNLSVVGFAEGLDASHRTPRMMRDWLTSRYMIYSRMPVSEAIPACKTVLRVRLSRVCFLTATRSKDYAIVEASPELLANKVVSCGNFERSTFRRHESAWAFSESRVVPDLASAETNCLTKAFASAKCLELRLPRTYSSADFAKVREAILAA